MYRLYLKRILDFFGAVVLFILTSPVFCITFILLKISNQGEAFFFQERPGYQERAFKIIKFKTMTDGKDRNGVLLPDNERITVVGRWVRMLSIDELPQLINVIRGEMSLVGPRPLLFKYLSLYTSRQRDRHLVKPGITGYAQVNGRNSISWKDKFELDLYYVANVSLALDLKILINTLVKVIRREGVNQSSERPMQPFNGMN